MKQLTTFRHNALIHSIYTFFRCADFVGVPLTGDRRGAGERTDPRQELRGQAYDVAHAVRCWSARHRYLQPGALEAVASDLLYKPIDPGLDIIDAVALELPDNWTGGNALHLFGSNSEDFNRRIELISQAQHTIACAFWCITNDATGGRFLDALSERIRAGVQVTIVLDANIAERFEYIRPGYCVFIQEITNRGVDLHLLQPSSPWLNTHRKMFVVDCTHAIVGGRNIGHQYASDEDGFLDIDVEIHGPEAAIIYAQVLALIRRDVIPTPISPQGEDRVSLVDQPAQLSPVEDTVIRCLVTAIRYAKKSIDMAYGYIILPRSVQKALLEAKQRGVDIRIVTNSEASVDYPYWAGAAFASLDPLVQAGVPVYLMKNRCLHSKCCVIDGVLATVGSHNLWTLSTLHDTETNLFIASKSMAKSLSESNLQIISDAELVDLNDWKVPASSSYRIANQLIWSWNG